MTYFSSTGVVRYTHDGFHRVVLEIDQQLVDYYYSLIPKYYKKQRQSWPAHITVVRYGLEIPTDVSSWGKFDGETVEFIYQAYVHSGEYYYWLNCFCKKLEEIRSGLGLSIRSRYTIPPAGFTKCFHATIGNYKD